MELLEVIPRKVERSGGKGGGCGVRQTQGPVPADQQGGGSLGDPLLTRLCLCRLENDAPF